MITTVNLHPVIRRWLARVKKESKIKTNRTRLINEMLFAEMERRERRAQCQKQES